MLFFFKQKTAYEMRISDWSSDVCSSDLAAERVGLAHGIEIAEHRAPVVLVVESEHAQRHADAAHEGRIVLADENHGRKSSAPGSSVQHAVYLVNDRLAAACKPGSTARRQTRLLMGVHSVPPWRAKTRQSGV